MVNIKFGQISFGGLVSFAIIAALPVFLIILAAIGVNTAHAQEANGPVTSDVVKPGQVVIDLTTLPPAPPDDKVVPEGRPDEGKGFVPSLSSEQDPVTQKSLGGMDQEESLTLDADSLTGTYLSAPVENFAGMTRNSPPDTVGDVGPNHYIQMVNATRFQIWDKQGNPFPPGPINLETLWTTAAAMMGDPTFQQNCQVSIGDPIVVYDHLADRWLLSQFANPTHMCIAISMTSDPVNGGWFLYQFNTDQFNAGLDGMGNPNAFPDYPKFGVWPDGYYMTSNENIQGAFVFDRANMLLGNPATFMKFTLPNDTACPRSSRVLPSDLDGPLPPASSPNFFIRAQEACQSGGGDQLLIYEYQADFVGGNPTFNLTTTINAASVPPLANFTLMPCNRGGPGMFQVRKCIRQPGTTQTIDALTGRPMMQLKYRHFQGSHESLVVNETVQVGGGGLTDNAGIRWWELRRTPAGSGNWVIHQQGTYAPNAVGATDATWVSRWMGSMAMDKDGNIGLGYSMVNGDVNNPINPSIAYTGRLATDTLGQMPQGEQMIIAGGAPQPAGAANCRACQRWGDYSAMSVDPVDDCTLWYTQQYIDGLGNGQTQIASFRFDTCEADLSITKADSPDPVAAGGVLMYTLTVTNNGAGTALDVQVADSLPAGVSYVSDDSGCSHLAGIVTCNLGDMMVSDTKVIKITVMVDPDLVDATGSATLSNQAEVMSLITPDPDTNNNSTTEDTEVRPGCDGLLATIVGTPGHDNIAGTPNNDVIATLAGRDNISSGDGNDTICSGSGGDNINAGSGEDFVDSGSGNDRISAGPGDDTVDGGPDRDYIFGGPGADICINAELTFGC